MPSKNSSFDSYQTFGQFQEKLGVTLFMLFFQCLKNMWQRPSGEYSEPRQISRINSKLLNIFTKNSILDVWQGSEYTYSLVRRVTWLCVIFWQHYEMREKNHAHATAMSVYRWQWQPNIFEKKHLRGKSQPYELSLT